MASEAYEEPLDYITNPIGKIVIMGAGQQGRICKRLAHVLGYAVVAFVDDNKGNMQVEGIPVYYNAEDIPNYAEYLYFVAVGEIEPRRKFIDKIAELGVGSLNLVDPSAQIEEGASIGIGNYIYKNAIIYASAKVGSHNIINCKAVLATDSEIGDNNNISMGCNICGGVKIGNDTYIGCNSSVVSGYKVGDGAVIAAGSVVLDDVEAGKFVAGAPAVEKERSK